MVPFFSLFATPDMSTMKKRNHNPLLPNSGDMKVMEDSQLKQYYLTTNAVCENMNNSLCSI